VLEEQLVRQFWFLDVTTPSHDFLQLPVVDQNARHITVSVVVFDVRLRLWLEGSWTIITLSFAVPY
jgi:hypothetical protein